MKLPKGHRAIVHIRKLRDYCLNPDSPKGPEQGASVRCFLSLTQSDAEVLRQILLQAAGSEECRPGEVDEHGRRYTVDLIVATDRGRQRVRSGWIVRLGEDFRASPLALF